MTAIDPLLIRIPEALRKDPATEQFFTYLLRVLTDIRAAVNGDTDSGTAISSVAVNAAAIAAITDSLPAYTISNETTDRTLDANAAVDGTGIDVAALAGTDVALLSDHDALVANHNELRDVVATIVNDMIAKNILGT